MENDSLQRELDEIFMGRAIEIARNGLGSVAPNPMVGAVLVRENRIVAEGYHAQYGGAHAEIMAFLQADNNQVDLTDATLYTTLEPCTHVGKTPPCCEAIAQRPIRRVVIATLDPNPQVHGSSIEALRKAGKEVEVGVLEEQARELNRRFFAFHDKKRPYIILKWAQTLDGFIDTKRSKEEPHPWITNHKCQVLVHKWRSEEMAVLVGTNTALRDNPELTVRLWSGRNPLRVIMDRTLSLPETLHLFDGAASTLVIAGNNLSASNRETTFNNLPNTELVLVDYMKGIEGVLLAELKKRNITSLIVEGGALILNNFLKQGLWDEARVFVGNQFFREGIAAPHLPDGLHYTYSIDQCQLHTFRNPIPRVI
ncbi:MAG: bifunctional diaminohydroxyphosphoribosylaminopyrimidine deaminase/5-amino-6-(5-phosphoribosylamino)uracil reductase RibD [Bacteroides sp.]